MNINKEVEIVGKYKIIYRCVKGREVKSLLEITKIILGNGINFEEL